MTGVELIAAEQRRQISEGDLLSKNELFNNGELQLAAATYCLGNHINPFNIDATAKSGIFISIKRLMLWPFNTKIFNEYRPEYFHPSDNKVDELIIAGALIAAEIDRIQNII